MLEFVTAESILSLSVVSVSLLAMAGTVAALRATRPAHEGSGVDTDAIVRNAPYYRLDNIVPRSVAAYK